MDAFVLLTGMFDWLSSSSLEDSKNAGFSSSFPDCSKVWTLQSSTRWAAFRKKKKKKADPRTSNISWGILRVYLWYSFLLSGRLYAQGLIITQHCTELTESFKFFNGVHDLEKILGHDGFMCLANILIIILTLLAWLTLL